MILQRPPWEIVSAINAALNESDKSHILRELPADHPFWVGANYAVDPFLGPPVRLILGDPPEFGPGVPIDLFDRLMAMILKKNLVGDNLVFAIEALSAKTTREQWHQWYRPILLGGLEVRLSPALFNRFCPSDCVVREFNVAQIVPYRGDLPSSFLLEPIYSDDRQIWFLLESEGKLIARGYSGEGERLHRFGDLADVLVRALPDQAGLVLDTHLVGGNLFVRDCLTVDQFFGRTTSPPLRERIRVVETLGHGLREKGFPIYSTDISVDLTPDRFNEELGIILESGFASVIVRDLDAIYSAASDRANFLIKPVSKTILTCTEIIAGEPGSKWAGMVGEIIGVGKRGKKDVHARVGLGLTNSQRGIVWSDREAYVGSRFDIECCGSTDQGELIVPVFKRWKEKR